MQAGIPFRRARLLQYTPANLPGREEKTIGAKMLAGRSGFLRERLGALVIGLAACVQAQVMWQTTHTRNETGGYASGNCLLANASLRVKVHPVFLDVEELT